MEILGNEILLHIQQKHECDTDDKIWPLAKENKSWENFMREKKPSRGCQSEKMADILYIHQCEKVQVKPASMYFCTEEVTVEVTSVSSESHLRFMDPISKVTYRNYTLTNYNRVCPYAFQ